MAATTAGIPNWPSKLLLNAHSLNGTYINTSSKVHGTLQKKGGKNVKSQRRGCRTLPLETFI